MNVAIPNHGVRELFNLTPQHLAQLAIGQFLVVIGTMLYRCKSFDGGSVAVIETLSEDQYKAQARAKKAEQRLAAMAGVLARRKALASA